MGRTVVRLVLTNNADQILADAGVKPASEVRRVEVNGVVDTGAAMMVLPESVVRQLGLPVTSEASVRYADHRTARRPIVSQLHVLLQGRESTFSAISEPDRKDPLVGVIVLEALDFLVDPRNQVLVPRDPERVVYEVE